jgi:hypothetical protein
MSQISTPEIAPARMYTFEEIQRDVTIVAPGEGVEVTNFSQEFDPLVVSLVLAAMPKPPGDRWMEPSTAFYTDIDCPRPLGTFAVRQPQGTDPIRKRQRFHDWPAILRLPSEPLLLKDHRKTVPYASVTVLDKRSGDAVNPGIDLLLQAHLRNTGAGTDVRMVRMTAERDGRNRVKPNYPPVTPDEAAHLVATAVDLRNS